VKKVTEIPVEEGWNNLKNESEISVEVNKCNSV
jgi:hypothetical protein